jgi:hypothetical protein
MLQFVSGAFGSLSVREVNASGVLSWGGEQLLVELALW